MTSAPNSSPRDEALAGDPSVSQAASDKVAMRVEGQNEVIKTPPKEEAEAIAETARQMKDITMGIEDES
jgi:hypothetical protein